MGQRTIVRPRMDPDRRPTGMRSMGDTRYHPAMESVVRHGALDGPRPAQSLTATNPGARSSTQKVDWSSHIDSARFSTRANAPIPDHHTLSQPPRVIAKNHKRASPTMTTMARSASPTTPSQSNVSTNVLCELATQPRPEKVMYPTWLTGSSQKAPNPNPLGPAPLEDAEHIAPDLAPPAEGLRPFQLLERAREGRPPR